VIWFWVERSEVNVRLTAIRRGFELYECVLVRHVITESRAMPLSLPVTVVIIESIISG